MRPKLHDRLPNLAGIEATVVAMRRRVKGTRSGQVVRTGRGAMPGHTPGTISLIFEVKDNGKPLTVAFPGGTEFNFVNDVAHFDTYISSARKLAAAAAAAGAAVLMTNQSEFDNAASKIRMLAARRPGEPHPLEAGR